MAGGGGNAVIRKILMVSRTRGLRVSAELVASVGGWNLHRSKNTLVWRSKRRRCVSVTDVEQKAAAAAAVFEIGLRRCRRRTERRGDGRSAATPLLDFV